MYRLDFTYNWNNKLNCKCFTTIRNANPEKYPLDREFEIYLKTEFKGVARLHDSIPFKLSKMPSFTAFLDTGYCREEAQNILRKMYHLQPTEDKDLLLLLLIYKNANK